MNVWKEVQIILDNWQEMAHAYETTRWAYTCLYEMLSMWGNLCYLTVGFGSTLQICRDCPYVTTNDHKSVIARWEALHVPPSSLVSITHRVRASNAWTTRFHNLLVFNASRLFSPNYCPSDGEVRITTWNQQLERLIINLDRCWLKAMQVELNCLSL